MGGSGDRAAVADLAAPPARDSRGDAAGRLRRGHDSGQRVEHQVRAARQQVSVGRRAALVGHVLGLNAGLGRQHGAGQVRDGARARRAVIQLPGLAARQIQKLFDRTDRQVRVDGQHHGHTGRERHAV